MKGFILERNKDRFGFGEEHKRREYLPGAVTKFLPSPTLSSSWAWQGSE